MKEYRKTSKCKRYHREYRISHRKEFCKYQNNFRKRNLKYYNRLSKEYQAENKDKVKAVQLFNRKVRLGVIKRLPCKVCGKKKVDGHHFDYSDPLKVIWLCRKHHIGLHHGTLV
jgi:hypothetical protein